MNEKVLQAELQSKVEKMLSPLFLKYHLDFSNLDAILKWRPIVLVIGNYSSGKSTLINELLGQDIQRTGQAPTDDSFTIITAGVVGEEAREIPGSTLVNDDTLPFGGFKKFGERFMSHFLMKKMESPVLENMAIIDSPGMLDSVTEKDRGYDYMAVLGEMANLADLIVLMFDPHKAGTIKETYTAIRSTLPEKSGEDRIIFVMSRVDECDNLSDLVRSYGALCWNMSQMTGRKDIPHVYLTYAPGEAEPSDILAPLAQERDQLITKIKSAPGFRVNHILEDIDKQVNELQLVCEAMTRFSQRGWQLFAKTSKIAFLFSIPVFFFGDMLIQSAISYPNETLLSALQSRTLNADNFILPTCLLALTLVLAWFIFSRFVFSGLKKKYANQSQDLVILDSEYKKNLWSKMQEKVQSLLAKATTRELWAGHSRNFSKIQRFLASDLQSYYDKIR